MDPKSPSLAPPRDQAAEPTKLKIILVSVLPGLGLALFSILAYQLFSAVPSRPHAIAPVQSAAAGSPKHPSPPGPEEKSQSVSASTIKEVETLKPIR